MRYMTNSFALVGYAALGLSLLSAPKAGWAQKVHVKAAISIQNLKVDAKSPANSTGIKVAKGDKITITGADGTTMGNSTSPAISYEGLKGAPKTGNNPNIAFDAQPMALVGWVGSNVNDTGGYFQVSENFGKPITISKDGTLFFAVNDQKRGYADNFGALRIKIAIAHEYDIYAETTDNNAAWGPGLVDIYPSDNLTISANGKVSYYPGGAAVSINGRGGQAHGKLLATTIAPETLIGKIGAGPPFLVGTTFANPNVGGSNGPLYLSVNDQITKGNAFTNNAGNITVVITVVRPAK